MILLLLVGAAIGSLGTIVALAPQSNPSAPSLQESIELDKLFELYMLPRGVNYNVLPWDTGSAIGTPITWEHTGIKDCEPYWHAQFGTYFCRSGSVLVTVRAKGTHSVLGKTVQPGGWNVRLMGSRAGVTYVAVDSDVISPELGHGLLEAVAAKPRNTITVTSIKKCGDYSNAAELYQITSPGRQLAFVRETLSCGSAGCSIWFVLTSEEEAAQRLIDPKDPLCR
jgi:hypothetical protein